MYGNVQHPEFPPGMLLRVPTWAAPILSVAMRMRPCIGFGTPIVAGQTLRKWWYCWRNLKWRHTRVPQNHPSHCFWSMGKNNGLGSYILGNPKFKVWMRMMRNDFEECRGASSIPTTITIIGYHYGILFINIIGKFGRPLSFDEPMFLILTPDTLLIKMLLEMPGMVRPCL